MVKATKGAAVGQWYRKKYGKSATRRLAIDRRKVSKNRTKSLLRWKSNPGRYDLLSRNGKVWDGPTSKRRYKSTYSRAYRPRKRAATGRKGGAKGRARAANGRFIKRR